MRLPAPAAVASRPQCASAPATPPRSPPFPIGTLVTKKVMGGGGTGSCARADDGPNKAINADPATSNEAVVIPCLPGTDDRRRVAGGRRGLKTGAGQALALCR